jgi:hypothetical protein
MKYILSVLTLLTVLTSSGYSQDTVQVKAGWNIIGSLSDGAVPQILGCVSSIRQSSVMFRVTDTNLRIL